MCASIEKKSLLLSPLNRQSNLMKTMQLSPRRSLSPGSPNMKIRVVKLSARRAEVKKYKKIKIQKIYFQKKSN
jgi:hypothetical protein